MSGPVSCGVSARSGGVEWSPVTHLRPVHPHVLAPPEPPRARLAPDERRTAVLRATVPLLREHGTTVTTRQIADAAGVAEGTLFRVFDDKTAILVAAIASALDPDPVVAAISALPVEGSLVGVLVPVVEEIERRSRELRTVLTVAHELARSQHEQFAACGAAVDPEPGSLAHAVQALRARQLRAPEEITAALTTVLAAHRDELRTDPAVCARILLSVATSTVQAPLSPTDPLSARDIVEVFLDGVRARPDLPESSC